MRTRKLRLVVLSLVTFSGLAQNNVNYQTTTGTPGSLNVTVGYLSGISSGSRNVFVGEEAGNSSSGSNNVYLGPAAGWQTSNYFQNIFIGSKAGQKYFGNYSVAIGTNAGGSGVATGEARPGGDLNVFIGQASGFYSNGYKNTFVGADSGRNATGSFNSFYGYLSGYNTLDGQSNVFLGSKAGHTNTSGDYNTYIGFEAGGANQTGTSNVYIGSQAGGTATGESNKLFIDNSATNTPLIWGDFNTEDLTFNVDQSSGSRVRVASNSVGISGLQFPNMTNANTTPITNPDGDNGVLSVDSNGDVILVIDQAGTGGITNSCTTVGYIPRVVDASGNLGCSVIFDDGANHVGVLYGTTPPTGVNFSVNGNFATTGIYNSSDRRFKKDIKMLTDGIKTVQSLEGKSYLWDRNVNSDRNFDDQLHSGLIAQDVEKVLPHLVLTDSDGYKSVNYIEIIPYLIEAVKEQQTQINDLKAQLSDSFKANNAELIILSNTRIISVSPNPSKDVIMVSFNVEKSVASAKLVVHDLNGNVLSSLSVNDRDNDITKTLQKDNFGVGVYIVSLVVNGKSIDSKKIVFN